MRSPHLFSLTFEHPFYNGATFSVYQRSDALETQGASRCPAIIRTATTRARPTAPEKASAQASFYARLSACACVFVVCAVLLVRYYADIASSRNASAQLGDIYEAAQVEATSVPSAAPSAHLRPPFPRLRLPTLDPKAGFLRRAAVHGIVHSCRQFGHLTAEEVWPTIYPDNPRLTVSTVFDELQERNRDIVAWAQH